MQCTHNILTAQGSTWGDTTPVTLLQDLFPFYRLHSLTTWLLILQLACLLFQVGQVSLTPPSWPSQVNTFQWLIEGTLGLVFITRFVSEYEDKLGKTGIIWMLGSLQMVRVCVCLLMTLPYYWLLTPTPTIYALYGLTLADLQRWKDQPLTFTRPKQVYPPPDLLDLNETVIRRCRSNDWRHGTMTVRS